MGGAEAARDRRALPRGAVTQEPAVPTAACRPRGEEPFLRFTPKVPPRPPVAAPEPGEGRGGERGRLGPSADGQAGTGGPAGQVPFCAVWGPRAAWDLKNGPRTGPEAGGGQGGGTPWCGGESHPRRDPEDSSRGGPAPTQVRTLQVGLEPGAGAAGTGLLGHSFSLGKQWGASSDSAARTWGEGTQQ